MLSTPTTELEAVNTLLSTIGESPVNRLENAAHVEASIARSILSEVNRTVQAKGWHWNTEVDFPLQPTTDGEIRLPANTLRCAVHDTSRDVVQRGLRLYDRGNHTYAFTSPVKAELVVLLDFDELPQAARELCVMRAAKTFQQRVLGSTVLYQFTARDEANAEADLMNAESESLGLNILSNSAVRRVLAR